MASDETPATFYDQLVDDYHLIFADWDTAIARQARVIQRMLNDNALSEGRVLDASCGIGTQAIGLAQAGFDVTASDISAASVARCAREASVRGLALHTAVADLRFLDRDISGRFDAVVSFDNALPHLLDERELAAAAGALLRVLLPGGLLLASIRDYDAVLQQRPSGDPPRRFETEDGERIVFQVWDWQDEVRYTVRHFLLQSSSNGWAVTERRTAYRALPRAELTTALRRAGFVSVDWRLPEQGGFYQPVVVARAPRP